MTPDNKEQLFSVPEVEMQTLPGALQVALDSHNLPPTSMSPSPSPGGTRRKRMFPRPSDPEDALRVTEPAGGGDLAWLLPSEGEDEPEASHYISPSL